MSRRRFGFTIIELLVAITIIAVLLAMLLPAVQQARASSRSAQCKNNLRQIGLATINFHDVNGAFPPARIMPRPGAPPELACGRGSVTWFVRIMPYLEQGNLAKEWDARLPFADHDQDIRDQALPIYVCPSRRSTDNARCETTTATLIAPCGCQGQQTFIGGATGDYAGNHGDLSPGAYGFTTDFYWGGFGSGVLISSRAFCADDTPRGWLDKISYRDVLDGTSNTFLAGESHVNPGGMNVAPEDGCIYDGWHFSFSARIGGPGVPVASGSKYVDTRLYSFGSAHAGRSHFVLADGSVRAVSTTIDETIYGRLCNRADGEVVGEY